MSRRREPVRTVSEPLCKRSACIVAAVRAVGPVILTGTRRYPNGSPPSRAKDHSCRLAVATSLTHADTYANSIGRISNIVPALLPVELRKIWTKGENEAKTDSMSPTQNIIVTPATKARAAFSPYAVSSDRGMVRDASFAFSAAIASALGSNLAVKGTSAHSCAQSCHSPVTRPKAL